jgi:hypothetical protein
VKDIAQIKERIAEIEGDALYQSGLKHPITTDENAPLALIQVSYETEIRTLRWVLADSYPIPMIPPAN